MIPEKWNKSSYKKFEKYLENLGDEEYKKFHSSLVSNSRYEMIGIRVPIMRKIAKEISKLSNIEEFLKYSKDKYYEEIMIQGLVISYIKDERLFYKYFEEHINKIDNWALCDTFCSAIKIVKKHEEKYFREGIKMALSQKEFISRTGLVIILDYFINEKNIDTILQTLNRIKSEKFYINMAEAWLLCELYIKFPNETKKFIADNELNRFTQNKAISKINDSYRVSQKDKEMLKNYRKLT